MEEEDDDFIDDHPSIISKQKTKVLWAEHHRQHHQQHDNGGKEACNNENSPVRKTISYSQSAHRPPRTGERTNQPTGKIVTYLPLLSLSTCYDNNKYNNGFQPTTNTAAKIHPALSLITSSASIFGSPFISLSVHRQQQQRSKQKQEKQKQKRSIEPRRSVSLKYGLLPAQQNQQSNRDLSRLGDDSEKNGSSAAKKSVEHRRSCSENEGFSSGGDVEVVEAVTERSADIEVNNNDCKLTTAEFKIPNSPYSPSSAEETCGGLVGRICNNDDQVNQSPSPLAAAAAPIVINQLGSYYRHGRPTDSTDSRSAAGAVGTTIGKILNSTPTAATGSCNKASPRSFEVGDEAVAAKAMRERLAYQQSELLRRGNFAISLEEMIVDLFKDPAEGKISVHKFIFELKSCGLDKNDPRLADMMNKFSSCDQERTLDEFDSDLNDSPNIKLDADAFKECILTSMSIVVRALQSQLVIPDWPGFCSIINGIYKECRAIDGGENSDYIPQLARMNKEHWGVSLCTIDGQRKSWGDSKVPFCMQSLMKAFNYAIVLNELGGEKVHEYIGQEPSGRLCNEICLDHSNKPHNPMINSGAIIVVALMKNGHTMADRFEHVSSMYRQFCADGYIGFSNQTFLSERDAADRNRALAYFMREYECFPAGAKLQETLDLYFQLCSIEANCESLAVMAATLANGGICPLTGERVVTNRACRDVLSLMHSCGMYDYSGQFAFQAGIPAKASVTGATILVIPNVMGICLFSPPLDKTGNSVKGVHFTMELIKRFNFHNYDSLVHGEEKKMDPRRKQTEIEQENCLHVLFAAKSGDQHALRRYFMQGMDFNVQDYDGRTVLHVAASDGQLEIVQFLRHVAKVNPHLKDRWGRTALDDARSFGFEEIERVMEEWMQPKSA